MLQVNHVLSLAVEASASPVGRQAAFLAEALGATVHVMPIGQEAPPGELRQQWREYSGAPEPVEVGLVPSPVSGDQSVEAIRRYVEEQGIDLIVTDTPPDRGPIPPLADSFVETLMEELDRSVYAVGQVADPKAIRRILVPTDLSDPSLEALKHAAGLASIYGSSLVLLHVIDTCPYVALTPTDRLSLRGRTLPEHRAHRRLQTFVDAGREAEVPVHSHLKFGDPADRIAHFADRNAIDLVVLSSHGTRDRPKRPFGRVAERVLRGVAAPIFLVKAFGHSLLSESRLSEGEGLEAGSGAESPEGE